MIKSKYTPAQLGMALSKTLKKQKEELEKPVYPQKKIEWIKLTANEIMSVIEEAINKFNTENDEQLGVNDVISVAQTTLNRILKATGTNRKKD